MEDIKWTPLDVGDIATAAVAVIAVVVSIAASIVVHRAGGPVIKVKVVYFLWIEPKVKSPFTPRFRSAVSSLNSASDTYRRFAADNYLTEFLRVVVTNRGRLDVGIDSIAHQRTNLDSRVITQKGDPAYPVILKAQSYLYLNQLYVDLKAYAGSPPRIRFVVTLTNGDEVRSRWVKLYDPPLL